MIVPSGSSPRDKVALVGDRLECLEELPKAHVASNGVEHHDQLSRVSWIQNEEICYSWSL